MFTNSKQNKFNFFTPFYISNADFYGIKKYKIKLIKIYYILLLHYTKIYNGKLF